MSTYPSALSYVGSPQITVSDADRAPSILILGDGNFEYTQALYDHETPIDRYFPGFVLSTEYKERETCNQYEGTKQRIAQLGSAGVRFEFGVDATQIHEKYIGRNFKHIIFNCPDMSQIGATDPTAALVRDFFQSASTLQLPGHNIHMTLIQPNDSLQDRTYYQHEKYGIVEAATRAGYELNCVYKPLQYTHQKTRGFRVVEGAERGMRHFVFEKQNGTISKDSIGQCFYLNRQTGNATLVPFYAIPERKIETAGLFHFSALGSCDRCYPNITWV